MSRLAPLLAATALALLGPAGAHDAFARPPTIPAGGPAAPEQGASGEDRVLDRLFEQLRMAPDEAGARAIESDIWETWLAAAPSAALEDKLRAAIQARDSYDLDGALALLDEVVEEAPDYAEGWNQRAFVRFLKGDLDEALADLERALAIEPRHFAAMAGQAIVLMQQGRTAPAQAILRKAVTINPWLKERGMLLPENRPPRPGEGPVEL